MSPQTISLLIGAGGLVVTIILNIGASMIGSALVEHRVGAIENIVNVRGVIAFENRMTSLEARMATAEYETQRLTRRVEKIEDGR